MSDEIPPVRPEEGMAAMRATTSFRCFSDSCSISNICMVQARVIQLVYGLESCSYARKDQIHTASSCLVPQFENRCGDSYLSASNVDTLHGNSLIF